MSVHGHGSNDQHAYLLYDSREKARRDSPEYLRYSAAYHAAETLAAKKMTAEANARAAEYRAQTDKAERDIAEYQRATAEAKAKRAAAEARVAEEKARADAAEAQIAALAAKLARLQQAALDGSPDR